MNWMVVVKYVVLLFVATFATGAIVALTAEALLTPYALTMGSAAVVFVLMLVLIPGAAVLTFAWLARNHPDMPYTHAAAVAGVTSLVGLFDVLLSDTPWWRWVGTLVVYALAIAAGVPLGNWLRHRRDQNEAVARGASAG
jgi:hypothetical protein